MLNFEQKWGFPNCVGAIDGYHVPIIAPKHDHTDYYNRKGWYSILLQAVVDSNYLFRDTCIGWPGRIHDARVLANFKLYNMGQEGELFANHSRNICGVQTGHQSIGDPAYPLLQWLMKPYSELANMTAEQKKFNFILSRNRMVIENVFGRLKGRWRRLQKRVDCDIKDTPDLILTCCVLHNILCEKQGEVYFDQWNIELDNPKPTPVVENMDNEQEFASAGNIRNAFCNFLNG
ncbi:hypothetical protein SNE40_020041 [Patella caerulea]|uniref:DDE Tnp4 domain-containing protein n=1 Tax=Patella caerulea TaxID=87958 RepID=A0AAN8IZ79_PATCE